MIWLDKGEEEWCSRTDGKGDEGEDENLPLGESEEGPGWMSAIMEEGDVDDGVRWYGKVRVRAGRALEMGIR